MEQRTNSVHVLHLQPDRLDYLGPDLNVFNQLTPEMTATAQQMPLLELATAVHGSSADKSRGNLFIDVGYSSDINARRTKAHGGVATPQRLCRTEEDIFQVAMLAMTEMTDLACQPDLAGKVFFGKERNRLFSGSSTKGNRIETMRVALTNAKHLVACHTDDKNDVKPGFKGVVNYSKWFYIAGEWWRLSLIGYSRKSISGFFHRRDRHMPLVERVVDYYHQMPDERKHVTPELLDFTSLAPEEMAKRMKPHANKCVCYSIFVDCLSVLTAQLKLSRWHLLALIANVVVSESPEFFRHATKLISESKGVTLARCASLSPTDLAVEFHNIAFDEKERRTKLRLRVPGQRHQPHYNIRQERTIVEQSVMNVFRLYVAFDHIDKRLASDPHFYGKAVSFMQDNHKHTGVHGAGALTGQHLIHIGVLCGLFPVGLIEHAEIGETTKSYKHLSAWEGMTDHTEDTRQLLKCLSVRLGLPLLIVENILCKFGQDQISRPPVPKWQAATANVWKKKKSSPCTDSVCRDQIGLYLFDDKKRHLTVTKDGIIYDKPLAGQCHPLNPKFSSHVSVGAVLYAYWERKVSGRHVIPMTTATREYLKKTREKRVVITGTNEHRVVAAVTNIAKKPRIRIRISHGKRKSSPNDAQRQPPKKKKGLSASHAKTDNETDDEMDDDYVEALVTKPSPGTASAQRSERAKRRSIVLEAPCMNHLLVLDAPAKSRFSLPLAQLATKALSGRRHEKKNLKYDSRHHKSPDGSTWRLVAASLLLPDGGSSNVKTWQPPSEIGRVLEQALFPESTILDGRRCHESRKFATRFLFVAAVLFGKVAQLNDLLPLATGALVDEQELVVFFEQGCSVRTPLAAARRQPDGDWAFAFVDVNGSFVGKVLRLKSK